MMNNQYDQDPTNQLLHYHTEMLKMAENVRSMYGRYLPIFILACAETAALLISLAIRLGSDPTANWHTIGIWIESQPILYVNLALLPPMFIVGYLVLMAGLNKREQFYERRAQTVRMEIEKVLQARSEIVLQGEPVSASLMERVVHRPAPRQPMVPHSPVQTTQDPRIGMGGPPPPPPHQ